MPDRGLIRRRLALGAALGLAAFIGVVLLVKGFVERNMGEGPPPKASVEATPLPREKPAVETPPLSLPQPPVGRGELIAAVQRAASAHAAAEPPPEANAELTGRDFLVKIPFGCDGQRTAATAGAPAWWEYDEARRTVRLRAQPENWTQADWVRALAGAVEFDAVEGFWTPRPWTGSEACPPPRKAAQPAPAPEAKAAPKTKAKAAADETPPPPVAALPSGERTMGLAMFFEPGGSRVVRRGGRPYEYVSKVEGEGPPAAPKGYRLTLAGRLVGFEGGEPVRCRAEDPYERPVCLIAVAFDRVAFEDGATGETLAEWRMN